MILDLIKKGVGLFTGNLTLIVGGLLLAALGTQTWRLHSEQTKTAETEATLQKTIARQAIELQASTKVALDASEKNRKLEATLASQAQENEHARQQDRLVSTRIADALRADNRLLHTTLANYAAPSGSAGDSDSVNACRERAATLGSLLDQSMRVQIDGADDAEGLAADARSLFKDAVNTRKALADANRKNVNAQ